MHVVIPHHQIVDCDMCQTAIVALKITAAPTGCVRNRATRRTEAGLSRGSTSHPGSPSNQERREDQGEQQVLRHVDGEQVVVAQIVDRAVERSQYHQQPRDEGRHPPARRGGRPRARRQGPIP